MAKRKPVKKAEAALTTQPKFPYTTVPNALRTVLREIPSRPRPAKVNLQLIKSWGVSDTNASTIPRVLKAVKLLSADGAPTDQYTAFMQPESGPAILGRHITDVYAPFFESSMEPFRESDADLRRLFHIHSGGSEQTLRLQIQTFKTLCEFATFNANAGSQITPIASHPGVVSPVAMTTHPSRGFSVHVDLHIHLPENKSSRDYQTIIEDIARYIYRYEDLPNA